MTTALQKRIRLRPRLFSEQFAANLRPLIDLIEHEYRALGKEQPGSRQQHLLRVIHPALVQLAEQLEEADL